MALPLVINPGDSGHISHHEEIHAFLDPVDSPFSIAQDASGTLAARPAAGVEGRYYLATDVGVLYRDSGAGWSPVHDMLKSWDANLLSSGNNLDTLTVPAVRATKTVAQTVANGVLTAVTMDTEEYDNDGMHSVASQTSRLTANRAGIYIVTGGVVWDLAGTTGSTIVVRYAAIRRSGTFTYPSLRWRGTGGSTPQSSALATVKMSIGDYVELVVQADTSPTTSVDVATADLAATFISSA